jgi:hypothetical protein
VPTAPPAPAPAPALPMRLCHVPRLPLSRTRPFRAPIATPGLPMPPAACCLPPTPCRCPWLLVAAAPVWMSRASQRHGRGARRSSGDVTPEQHAAPSPVVSAAARRARPSMRGGARGGRRDSNRVSRGCCSGHSVSTIYYFTFIFKSSRMIHDRRNYAYTCAQTHAHACAL